MINSRLLSIIRKEFIQMRRDRRTLAMMLMLPVIQLLLFGYVSTDVPHLPTAVYDQCNQTPSRQLLQAFKNSQYFDLDFYVTNRHQVTQLIDKGTAKVGIIIPPTFAKDLHNPQGAQVQVVVDASDPITASNALSTTAAIGQLMSTRILGQRLQQAGIITTESPPVDIRVRAWYNPDLRNTNFMVPGLIALILTMVTMMVTAIAVVRERERGTMEQLIVTPIKSLELMLGKIIPYILVGYANMTIALLLATLWFHVPIAGSLALLYLLAFIYMLGTLGLGIFISVLSQNQMQAMQLSFFIFLPSILLSGFMFPREAMPKFLELIGYVIPLTYFLQILRGIVLKGIGLTQLWTQAGCLLLFALLMLTLSVSLFRKKLA